MSRWATANPGGSWRKQRAELVLERRDAREEFIDLGLAAGELLVVRDRARELEAEPEVIRHLRAPALDGFGRRQRVERRVALDRVEHLGVALEELRRPRAGRKQPANPALEAPAGQPR